ncbi:MAG: hypothetical protein ACYSXF_02220 [Planctomycetota bacterium]|jgi:hypothetical protein
MTVPTSGQHKKTVAASLHTLLEAIVDYAGLFPPARLDMPTTVRNYAEYRAGPDAWMLGRIVVPVARLDEFEGHASALLPVEQEAEPWHLSALTAPAGDPGLPADLERIGTFNEAHRDAAAGLAVIEVIELRGQGADVIDQALRTIPDELVAFFELPIGEDPRGLIAALAGSGFGAKVRSGGLTSANFPSNEQLARFLAACAIAPVPFKATAGLHHPVRRYDDSVKTKMHGFLNVFVAACLLCASGLDESELIELLDDESPDAFTFGDDGLGWRGRRATTGDVAEARAHLAISFGSCSFDEPREDLRALHLL